MPKVVIDEDAPHAIEHGIYKFYEVNGVKTYTLGNNYDKWEIDALPDKQGPKYLCIDALYHEAISHWVFESAIYLPLFNELKAKYPELRLHLKGPEKKYKALFCKYFDITDYTYELPPENTCFFLNPISSQHRKTLNAAFEPQLHQFINCFKSKYSVTKTNDLLILPRQSRENYAANERNIPFDNIIQTASARPPDSWKVLNTDDIDDLKHQIELVRSSKKLVLVDGAAFVINAMFAQNTDIYIIGNNTIWQAQIFPLAGLLMTMISTDNNNTLYYTDINTVCESIRLLAI